MHLNDLQHTSKMSQDWNDSQPIYRQIRDRVVAMILDGSLAAGEPLPSVRVVATDSRVNPLTVLKAYQQLVDEGIVEARRGLGMFVNEGAQALLLRDERARFIEQEWPQIAATIERLGLTMDELVMSEARKTKQRSAKR
jgi:GntR family transcriptional regulator